MESIIHVFSVIAVMLLVVILQLSRINHPCWMNLLLNLQIHHLLQLLSLTLRQSYWPLCWSQKLAKTAPTYSLSPTIPTV